MRRAGINSGASVTLIGVLVGRAAGDRATDDDRDEARIAWIPWEVGSVECVSA
ncbi:MAG: hypothetical protein QOH50_1386 [Kribbellaceae bacterium]|jgi:hypothetical protein|nr:hypothetical protein [Kribbellaceae bacterium]